MFSLLVLTLTTMFFSVAPLMIFTLMIFLAFITLTPSGFLFSHMYISFFKTGGMDNVSFFLILLLFLNFFSCFVSTLVMQSNNKDPLLFYLISVLVYISFMFFILNSWLKFYIFFELSLIPILLIILGWGYQVERLKAAKAMMLYTILGSMPLFTLILYMSLSGFTLFFQNTSFSVYEEFLEPVLILALTAFLVKLPMFLFHMWLPKAHVEAPVVGSMFLAAILLKLGGFGLMKMNFLLLSSSLMSYLFLSIGLWSLVYISLLCTQLLDMKILIAFSSVAHMGVGLMVLLTNSKLGLACILMVLISHGFSSSFMFLQSFMFYKMFHTRSLVLTKGSSSTLGLFLLFWSIACLGMMGAPPTVNLWVEVNSFIISSLLVSTSMKFLFSAAFLTGVYSLLTLSFPYSGNQKSFVTQISFQMKMNLYHLSFNAALLIGFTFFMMMLAF